MKAVVVNGMVYSLSLRCSFARACVGIPAGLRRTGFGGKGRARNSTVVFTSAPSSACQYHIHGNAGSGVTRLDRKNAPTHAKQACFKFVTRVSSPAATAIMGKVGLPRPTTPILMTTPLISGVRDRLPKPQPFCDQRGALPIVASLQDAHVLRIGAPENTGRPRLHARGRVRTSREVPGRAIGGLQQDFSRPVQLRCVRIPRPFPFPIIEDARRLLPLLRRFAPVSRGQPTIL